MSNKKNTNNKKAIEKTLGYRVSKKILGIPVPVLYFLATGFSLLTGYLNKKNAEVYSGLNETFDGFFGALVRVSLCMMLAHYFVCVFAKSARLNAINNIYLKEFKRALKSTISQINKLSPERICGLTSSIAIYQADIKSAFIDIIAAIIPFSVICYTIGQINLYAAVGMVAIMAIVIALDLYSDKLFRFDTVKSEMKSEMQGISVALFMSITMLKYMNAEKWAYHKLDEAQNKATPAMQNSPKQVYNLFVGLLSCIPELACMGWAAKSGDATLALYCAFNIGAIYNMMHLLEGTAETSSELDGEKNAASELKGDDKPYSMKPAFPVKLILTNVEFFYESDEDGLKPFIFGHVVLEAGKKYRFVGPSGSGKSSAFKYFAGEMISKNQPDFRTFYVHQKACLINLVTLRENITLGNEYVPDGDIIYLLEEMGMGDWVRNLPKGLDSIVGVDVNPSGGESSRISLMRAFLHVRNYGPDPLHRVRNTSDLIMMDEVTSALDKRTRWLKPGELCTEEKVIKLCEKEFAGCTVAIISHEDETSSAIGFRDIVDYEIRLEVRQNGNREEHIFCAPEAVNFQKVRNDNLRVAK